MIIGLNGFKNVGKDTVADYLVAVYGFTKVSFADPLKDFVCAVHGITREQLEVMKNDPASRVFVQGPVEVDGVSKALEIKAELTVREYLQHVGTKAREIFGNDFWIDLLLPKAAGLFTDKFIAADWVISDARFNNEIGRIKHLEGFNIRIERPGYVSDGHESEKKPREDLTDYVLVNSGTFEGLYRDVDEIVRDMRATRP